VQRSSDIERIERRYVDLQKVIGYGVLEREIVTFLSESNDSQVFASTITEKMKKKKKKKKKISELLAFIEKAG